MISNILSPTLTAGCSERGETLDNLRIALHVEKLPIIKMNQTHGKNIKKVQINTKFEQEIPDTDACYTLDKNLVIVVKTADCLPILFYHPSGVIGGIHAGRKGTQLGITAETFQHLKREEGLRDKFEIWFGPAICKKCYQIDPITDLHYDLIEENKKQLEHVSQGNKIRYSNLCTSCENHRFYSYRKEKTEQRLYSLIAMT